MKKYLFLAALLTTLSFPALAQRVSAPQVNPLFSSSVPSVSGLRSRIVAVVNDGVITSTDLEQRTRIAILSSGLPDNSEVRAHLLPQILRALIEEQLQVQEAKKLDLSVSKEEVDQALSRIAQDNNIPGDLLSFLEGRGISPAAMTSQVRNGILWSKVVQREIRPRVDIGEEEIDAVINRVRANAGKDEYLVGEILLTVENPKDEDQVRQVADNLVQQIRGGANFSAVAHQFSQGVGAAQGGDMGWIQPGQLSPELNKALAASTPGQVSMPIRTAKGFHILGVRGKRTVSLGNADEASLNLVQAFHSYAGTDPKALAASAMRVRTGVKSCASIDKDLSDFPGWKAQKLGEMTLAKAPSWLADKVRNVAAGSSSEPLNTEKGVIVLFVCNRKEKGDVDREAILRSIGTEKLELQARRLLRDLRRNAYVDIRLGPSGAN